MLRVFWVGRHFAVGRREDPGGKTSSLGVYNLMGRGTWSPGRVCVGGWVGGREGEGVAVKGLILSEGVLSR